MRAAVYTVGEDIGWKMADIPVPHHSSFSVLIQVKAVALNPSNFKHPMITATWPFIRHLRKDWPIGYDVSGVVLSAGTSRACNVKAGDKVWGISIGVAGEFAVLPCFLTVPIPGKLSFEEAAGLGVAGLTTLMGYECSGLGPKQKVLVVGASGGCGQFGVMLAGAIGAKVTGICGSQNVDFVKQLHTSVDAVFDYKQPFKMAGLFSKGRYFDVIYDTVTSSAPEDPNYEPMLGPLRKENGTYLAIGPCPKSSDQFRTFWDGFTRPFGLQLQREGYDWYFLLPTKSLMLKLNSFFDSGKLTEVPIDSKYDALESNDAIEQAMDRQKSRRAVGKILLTFDRFASRASRAFLFRGSRDLAGLQGLSVPDAALELVGEHLPRIRLLPARLWRRLLQKLETEEGNSKFRPFVRQYRVDGLPLTQWPWAVFGFPDAGKCLALAVWNHLTALEVEVCGRRTNKEEFVTAGGVDVRELHWDRMELRSCPGLHFAGEIVDIDGITGGFNFQGCWSTGYAAGIAAADAFD
ncbi:CEQORH [Symbiodinium necroappetens]|uniref:CEQORH protein n=1 Tax=Symbiodinium necroappetens TaxID=1628268 RepID=A0A812RWV0_9DINO|nr:CEQORH [Symbiodinium necroappetens]